MSWKVSKLWREEMPAYVPVLQRFGHALLHDWADVTHAYVDLFVEGRRTFAYTFGHVAAIAYPLGALLWMLL